METPSNLISVIVPFYQKTSGILRRSIDSAVRQTVLTTHQIEFIVVDDGSPVSGQSELKELNLPENFSLRVISQENRGPAAARNRGLDEVNKATKFIAFLDSDDCWTDNHLSNAVKALGDQSNFYFSDFYQLDQSVSAFDRAKRLELENHSQLKSGGTLFEYRGNMVEQVVTGNIIGTSTVVYRHSTAPTLRFREEFFNAGEDYLFWIDFCYENNSIVFSSEQECIYGRGVNIYSGVEWGSSALFNRILNELKYRKLLLEELPLDQKTKSVVREKIKILRVELAKQILHRILHSKGKPMSELKKAFEIDRLAIFFLPLYMLSSIK